MQSTHKMLLLVFQQAFYFCASFVIMAGIVVFSVYSNYVMYIFRISVGECTQKIYRIYTQLCWKMEIHFSISWKHNIYKIERVVMMSLSFYVILIACTLCIAYCLVHRLFAIFSTRSNFSNLIRASILF